MKQKLKSAPKPTPEEKRDLSNYFHFAWNEKLFTSVWFKEQDCDPFNTNAGYGACSGFETVKELCPKSKVLEGFEIKAVAERDGQYLVIKDQKAKQAEKEVKKRLHKIKVII